MKHLLVVLCAVIAMAAVVVGRQATTAPARAVLLKTDVTDAPGKEGVMLSFVMPPGPAAGRHFHPGDEFIYLVEGEFTFELDGQAPVTLKPGQTLRIPAKVIHRAFNPSATTPAKLISFGLFQKGVPDTTAVK